MNRVGALTKLLQDLFADVPALKAWVKTDPQLAGIAPHVAFNQALATVCLDVVESAKARGLWNQAAFESLIQARPESDFEIQMVARQWGVFAILPDPQLARGVEMYFGMAPGHPGTPQNLRTLAAAADIDLRGRSFLPFDQILQEANARQPTDDNVHALKRLLDTLADMTQARPMEPNHPIARALDALTTSQSDPRDAQVPVVQVVEVQEAVILDSVGFLPAGFLDRGAAAARTVARLSVLRQFGTHVSTAFTHGTGFLLTDRLLLTNHHVINARHANEPDAVHDDLLAQVQSMVVEFDVDGPGQQGEPIPVSALLAYSPRRSVKHPGGLDFAVLRLSMPVGDDQRVPRPLRDGPLPDSVAINIVQHPAGGFKCLALRANQLAEQADTAIRYTSNTDEGSSGSPLFDDDWNVVGLHRASVGTNTEFQGRSIHKLNVGTPMRAILDSLRQGTAEGSKVEEAWRAIQEWHGLG